MFEKASKLKLRFKTSVGNLTVEDLWDIPLSGRGVSLDKVAKALNKTIKEGDEESFVVKKSSKDTALHLSFDIVKHIIEARLLEAEKNEKRAENSAKKEKILSIIADKEDDALKGKSAEELKDLVANL